MSRGRHLRLVLTAALPLLVVMIGLTAGRGGSAVLVAVLGWSAGTLLLAELLWRRAVAPAAGLMEEISADGFEEAMHRLHELRAEIGECADQRRHLAGLLEDLTRSLGEGLVVVDAELHLRLINRVALTFCGTESATEGAPLVEVMRVPEVLGAIGAAAGGQSPDAVVVENPRGLWELRAFPIRDGGAVVLISDEGLVRRAAEFRRRFVQDLSHELRSPLAVLRTTVEAVEDEISPRLVEVLVRQVERLDRLTRELYDLATIESGQLELQLERVPLRPVLDEVFKDFSPEAERAVVAIELSVPEDLYALCDRRGLYRVLSNLVDNAVKYNREGGRVKLSASVAETEVKLKVADTGEGIPAGELKAVLQRFYRRDRARTPGRGGLGLGLAIVKHLVQHMGGRLELDSREGVGTTVTLVFPVA